MTQNKLATRTDITSFEGCYCASCVRFLGRGTARVYHLHPGNASILDLDFRLAPDQRNASGIVGSIRLITKYRSESQSELDEGSIR